MNFFRGIINGLSIEISAIAVAWGLLYLVSHMQTVIVI